MILTVILLLFVGTVGISSSLSVMAMLVTQDDKTVLGSSRKLASSLEGRIYLLEPGTSRLPDFSQLTPVGKVYATELNVSPRSFTDGFPGVVDRFEWFAIDYHGKFNLARSGKYSFRLTSDDGSLLFIDGEKIIDNDGLHPPRATEGSKHLAYGLHQIRVQYFQGPATTIALVLEVAREGEEFAPFPSLQMGLVSNNWLEALMDTTTLIATVALLAFMIERLTNGLAILLGYWGWWRLRMEVGANLDSDTRSRVERNRRVGLFGMSSLLGVIGALLLDVNFLAQVGFGSPDGTAGEIGSGLLLAAGADPIREYLKIQEGKGEAPPTPPVQVTGTVVFQQTPPGPSKAV